MSEPNDLLKKLELCESEIEKLFLRAAYERIDGLTPQYQVLNYRIDFAVPDKMIAIEIDGHDFHKTKEQRTNDSQREREIKLALPTNWTVIRFTGSEIFQNATFCVDEVLQFMNKNQNFSNKIYALKDNVYAFLRSMIKRKSNITKNSGNWCSKGQTLSKKNKYDDAIQALDESLEIDPQLPDGVTKVELLTKPYYWAGKALELFDQMAVTGYPYFDISTINKDNYEEAIKCYNNAIKLDPFNTGWYYGKARVCTALSFYAEKMHAQDEFDLYFNETLETYKKAMKLDPLDARFWIEIGIFLNQLGKYEKANDAFDKAIGVNQNDEWLNFNIWDGKIYALTSIANTKPHDADIWYAIGNAWVKKGSDVVSRYKAIQAYDKAIINKPNFVEAWFSKGLALKQWSNEQSSKETETSIKAAFAMAESKYDEAIKAYDEVIKLDPKYSDPWYNKGLILMDQGNYTEALRSFDEAIELNSTDAISYYAKGVTLKLLGRTTEADATFAKARDLGYTG